MAQLEVDDDASTDDEHDDGRPHCTSSKKESEVRTSRENARSYLYALTEGMTSDVKASTICNPSRHCAFVHSLVELKSGGELTSGDAGNSSRKLEAVAVILHSLYNLTALEAYIGTCAHARTAPRGMIKLYRRSEIECVKSVRVLQERSRSLKCVVLSVQRYILVFLFCIFSDKTRYAVSSVQQYMLVICLVFSNET